MKTKQKTSKENKICREEKKKLPFAKTNLLKHQEAATQNKEKKSPRERKMKTKQKCCLKNQKNKTK